MGGLFLLLFRKSYWRMLLRAASWQEAWVSLTRAHKDRRARKHLGRFGLMLLAPALCFFYVLWLVGTGGLVLLPIVALVIWLQARRAKDNLPMPSVVPGPETADRTLTEAERRALREYFCEVGLVCSVMVARAGSESFLKEKELPEGMQIVSRRVHLELLKRKGLWERMSRSDREAAMMPDGHWDWALINRVALGLEALRLLRWMLRIDYYLPLVGQQLKGDFAQAYELVRAPEKLGAGTELAEIETVRVGRNSADMFFQRCVAEAICRGYYEAANAEAAAWAKRVSGTMGGQQHEDFLLGGKLVSEATREELLWATSVAKRRKDFLGWALAVMRAGKAPEGPLLAIAGAEA